MTTAQFRQVVFMLLLCAMIYVDDLSIVAFAIGFTLAYGVGSIIPARKNQ